MNDFFVLLLGLACVITVVLGFNSFANKIRNEPLELKFFLIPLIMFVVGMTGGLITSGSNKDAENSPVISSETKETKEEESSEGGTLDAYIDTELESPEEFKVSCQEIDYKKLLRKPEDFIGQRIVITAKVQQVMNGGLFDDGKYYRVQTDNGNQEWYLDDEYFMYDYRIGDDMKILKEDVLKIYAEFSGLEEVKRALTKSDEEVPAIKAYYVELISE